jgi:hypothetical protein
VIDSYTITVDVAENRNTANARSRNKKAKEYPDALHSGISHPG